MTPHQPFIEDIEERLGYHFNDTGLLCRALTHSSYAAEHEEVTSYERLEFLGDAVLELVTTCIIFEAETGAPEGVMTKIRASVVDEATLAAVASDLGLSEAMHLGRGEERSGGRDRDSILSDVVEAVLGAVFLDGGWEDADRVIRAMWTPIVQARSASSGITDPRSHLQELLATDGRTVTFSYDRSGPDHAVVFTAVAFVDGSQIAVGMGSSKKAAAIDAARAALEAGIV